MKSTVHVKLLVVVLAALMAGCAPSIKYFEPAPLVHEFNPKIDRTLNVYFTPKIIDSARGVKDFRKSLAKGFENLFADNVKELRFIDKRDQSGLLLTIEFFAAGASGSGMGAQFYIYDYKATLTDGTFEVQSARRKAEGNSPYGGYQGATKYAVEQALSDLAEVFFNSRTLRMVAK